MPIQFCYKTKDTLLCFFPNGDVDYDDSGKPSLVTKPSQHSDTCWYDGAMMLANLLMRDLKNLPELEPVNAHKEETGALFLLSHCFSQFVNQYDNDKLQALCNHPDILSINFPQEFLLRLRVAINTAERKKILFDHLSLAIYEGKEAAVKSLERIINKRRFDSATICLQSTGLDSASQNLIRINSSLSKELQHNEMIQILQKDSIVDWLFNYLTIKSTSKPTSPQDLYNILEQSGPLLVKGHFGIDSYNTGTNRQIGNIGTIKIHGWNKGDYKEDSDFSLHATIIVGIKVDKINPEQSRIYFLDPRQTLNPKREQIVYSVSFAKYMSKMQNIYLLSDYNLTAEHQKALNGNHKKLNSDLKKGFFNTKSTTDNICPVTAREEDISPATSGPASSIHNP